MQRSDENDSLDVHRGKEAVSSPDVCAHDLILMVVDYKRVVWLLKVPNLQSLVHRTRNQLGVMEQDTVDVIVMSVEFVDASACLEAEYIHVVIFASKRKTLLARELTSHADTAVANEETLATGVGILFKIKLVHLDEAIA
jgi:hypothetical protein